MHAPDGSFDPAAAPTGRLPALWLRARAWMARRRDALARPFLVLGAAIAEDRVRPPAPARRPEERAFLPALLEATETPPSPSGRILAAVLCGLVAFALAWSWIGRVDVVAEAEGRTVASGRSKVVQPPESGVVAAIRVRDGQAVREGDVLVELDRTMADAEHERMRQEILASHLAIARLRLLVAVLDGSAAADAPLRLAGLPGADPAQVAAHESLLLDEVAEHRARRMNLMQELARRAAERATAEASIARLNEVIPLVAARADARAELARGGHGSRLTYLEARQQLLEAEHERVIQRRRIQEIDAAAAALRTQAGQLEAETLRQRRAELTEKEHLAAAQAQDALRADQRRRLLTLTAPIAGVVQQLAIHTVGGVVQPAQQLMVIAPQDDGLEVEALVLNRDVGFVRPGQPAEIKLEAFNFTRFGLVPGRVVALSGDAIQDEQRGPVYAARIALLRDAMTVDGRPVALMPGLKVTAEIRTGSRRVLDYLLSPLARHAHEAIRER